jgi:hypothetical protein
VGMLEDLKNWYVRLVSATLHRNNLNILVNNLLGVF